MTMFACTQLLFLVVTIQSARILVVLPSAFYSHQLPLKHFYKELSLRGHQVVAITTSPINNSKLINLTEINIDYVNRFIQNVSFARQFAERSIYSLTHLYLSTLGEVAQEIFTDSRVQRLLKDEKEHFNLVIVEWCTHPVYAALSQRFNSPLVGFRSMDLRPMCHEEIGNPTNPSYIPTGTTDFRPDFWGRLKNAFVYAIQILLHHTVLLPKAKLIIEKHLKGFSIDIENAERKVSVVITNTHPILNGIRPVVPIYIQAPYLHLRGTKPPKLSKDLKLFLDNATEGVIYVNFGSVLNYKDVEGEQLQTLTKVLGKQPHKVLWKLTGNKFSSLPQNIKMVEWVSQRMVLAHRNVKLFLTHGGLLSYQEAVHYKVPMVGLPFCGDQFVNVNRMVELHIGKRLDYFSMNEESAISVIREVIENTTYKERISRVSDMIREQERMAPLEKAVWWTEYVLRHNGTLYMESPAVDLKYCQFLLFDTIAFLSFTTTLTAALIYATITIVIKHCSTKKKSKKE